MDKKESKEEKELTWTVQQTVPNKNSLSHQFIWDATCGE